MKLRLLVGVALGAFFLYLSLRSVDLGVIGETLKRTDYLYFVGFIGLNLLALAIRALRWSYLLRPIQLVSYRRLLSPLCIGMLANFIFPARAGEFIRAYIAGRKEDVSKSAVFGTVVVERLFDGLAIISFLGLAPFFLPRGEGSKVEQLQWAGFGIFLAYLAVFAVLLALSRHRELITRFLADSTPARRWKIVRKLFEMLQKFTEGLAVLESPSEVLGALTLSFVIWGISGLTNLLMLQSVDLALPLYASFFLVVLQSFGVMVPSPGFVGSYQFAHIVALSIYGVSESVAFSLAILIHGGYFILFIATGLYFLVREHYSWGELEKASSGDP